MAKKVMQMKDKLAKKPVEPDWKDIGEGKFEVKSFSNPEIVYTVDAIGETCTCPFFEKRQIECKHLKSLRKVEL